MRTRLPLAALLFAVPVLGQTTWSVPAGGNLNSYIAQAAPGDVLLLAGTGSYFSVAVTKGVTILGNGASIYEASFQVPPGQHASLADVRLPYMGPFGVNTITITSGLVELSDITHFGAAQFAVSGGSVVMQRCWGGLSVAGGACWVANSTIGGRPAISISGFGNWQSSPGIFQSGGEIYASHCTVGGGGGAMESVPWPSYMGASAGLFQTAGIARLTDCTVTGGSGVGVPWPGAVAVFGAGNVSIARSTIAEGTFATTASSGFVEDSAMVGMESSGPPTVGASFSITARFGSSQELVGLVGGFQRLTSILPPIVEPLFGDPAQLIVLLISPPPVGGSLTAPVAVPNVLSLRGSEVWLQALQVDDATIRASTVVGGVIR